ncbi:hypothetical protein X756_00350 [Mesorhizobium sp. LSHC412B00]|nr:hypothetical protein X756_00350 [Mesorhizobium sp. LSHC412B00]
MQTAPPPTGLWKQTVKDYLVQRIEPRYLAPIADLTKLNRLRGEGFSVATIQCALIEFLAALRAGENYKYKNPDINNFEYKNSSKLFTEFLANQAPFSNTFTAAAAGDFYRDIRCGLLHEGQSKNGWLVKKGSRAGVVVDWGSPCILYWENLQDAITAYLKQYYRDLEIDQSLQSAFIRKYNHLSTNAI